jgi:pimeloyl-[acyl-carrier protein] methyl ester esterase
MTPRTVFRSGWAHGAEAGRAFLDACGLRESSPGEEADAVLVGWSLGALRTLQAAADRPCRGLVLLAPTARFLASDDGWPGATAASLRALRAGLRRDPERALRSFFEQCEAPDPLDPAAAEARIQGALAGGLPPLLDGLDFLREADLRGAAARIEAPALLIHGRTDRVVPAAASTRLAGIMPRARRVEIDGGHAAPLRAEEAVRAARDFLRRLSEEGCAGHG